MSPNSSTQDITVGDVVAVEKLARGRLSDEVYKERKKGQRCVLLVYDLFSTLVRKISCVH